MRQISTVDFSNTSASWIDKTTLDIDCELVREMCKTKDKYLYLPVALRPKKHMFEFDAKLPSNASISLVENDFRDYYLEYEFFHMCKDAFGVKKEELPSYTLNKVRKLITYGTPEQKTYADDLNIKESKIGKEATIFDEKFWKEVENNGKIKNFLKLITHNSIIILKIPRKADFSILKIADLNTGIDGLRKCWHIDIFNPIAQFPLKGKIADVTKVIMPGDVRLSRAVIVHKQDENNTARVSELDIRGDGAWGVEEFKKEISGEFLGQFTISPKRSQMITIGLMLTTIALLVCSGCIWKGIKIDIFNSDKPSIIWTMAIPVMVFILTRLAVKDQSSSYFHNMITRKYRAYLITSFILLILVCCWDDRSWNNWSGFQSLNSFYPIKWFVEHNVHPGWLTIGLTFVITAIWLGFLVSYFRARPKNFRNLSYST